MIRILAILTQDKAYGERLSDYLNTSDRFGLTAIAYTSAASYREHIRDYKTEILLTDELLTEHIESDEGVCRICLSEDGFTTEGGYPCVCKYKAADELMRDILRIYSSSDEQHLICVAGVRSVITGIYSPIGRIGKSTWAITYAMARAKREKTLLITLEEYAGIYRNLSDSAMADMSDVIYYFLQGNCSWSKLRSAVLSYGKLDYIPPVRYAEDLAQLSDDQLHELFIRISGESGYEHIVIDFGAFGKKAASLLETCSYIHMPVISDVAADIKIEEFMSYLDVSGRGHVREKIQSIRLPYEPGRVYGHPEISDYSSGQEYEMAVSMISKEDKSDETREAL